MDKQTNRQWTNTQTDYGQTHKQTMDKHTQTMDKHTNRQWTNTQTDNGQTHTDNGQTHKQTMDKHKQTMDKHINRQTNGHTHNQTENLSTKQDGQTSQQATRPANTSDDKRPHNTQTNHLTRLVSETMGILCIIAYQDLIRVYST